MLELLGCLLTLAATTPAAAQVATDAAADPSPGTEERRVYPDPWDAYEAGAYDQALQGFVDRQVERPEDEALALNVGSAHYEMRNYEEAEREFARAAVAGEPELRRDALYNLGNSEFRQGRLEEAVELFKAALEVDPEDEDAKFNLEFVRDEIRRRHEEAQRRQEEQQQSPPDQEQSQDPSQGEGEQRPEPQSGEQPEDRSEAEGEQPPDEEQGRPEPTDGDGDGLPDEVEREGRNPTDPTNPDSDGDGLPDGAEDLNRNGGLDEGETDPNNPDSDGDGTSDGEEAGVSSAGEVGQEPPDLEGMTPEEAERYLQALEEGRPVRKHPSQGRQRRPEKDW